MVPDLLITYGGHIVSKRLKQFLRKHPPREHWHVSLSGEVTDLYGSLTTVIEMDPFEFLEKIAYLLENRTTEFPRIWENNTRDLPQPEFSYSEMAAIGTLIKSLPTPAALHLGNSSAVRYAQLYTLPEDVEVCCNRGTSGIEGSLSTAIGYSVCSDKLNFVVIGDLSFFYDMNALWNSNFGCNLRILLLNNGGGEIFQALPGLKMEDKTRRFVTATHKTSAKGWAKERGFSYLPVHNDEELTSAMAVFTQSAPHNQPMLMEVFTDASEDVRLLKEYYHQTKKNKNITHNLIILNLTLWKQKEEWTTIKEYEEILFDFYNGIARITINRERYRNAFTPTTTTEMSDALYICRERPDINVVVLTGAGDTAFCAGGDMHVKGHGGYIGKDGVARLNVLDVQKQIRSIPKP